MKIATLFAFVAMLCLTCGSHQAQAQPAFCNGLNCPNFTTVLNCSSFEIRNYPQQQWVSFITEGPTAEYFTKAGHKGFDHLFNYISGANSQNLTIPMTAPVAIDVTPGAGPDCNTTFRVSFYIPYDLQGNAPQPTDPAVSLYTRPAQYLGVRSFGGFVADWTLSAVPELIELGLELDKNSITYTQTSETVSQYNGPFTIFNRHNEVWLVVNPKTVPQQCS
jgi:hypothetical protein